MSGIAERRAVLTERKSSPVHCYCSILMIWKAYSSTVQLSKRLENRDKTLLRLNRQRSVAIRAVQQDSKTRYSVPIPIRTKNRSGLSVQAGFGSYRVTSLRLQTVIFPLELYRYYICRFFIILPMKCWFIRYSAFAAVRVIFFKQRRIFSVVNRLTAILKNQVHSLILWKAIGSKSKNELVYFLRTLMKMQPISVLPISNSLPTPIHSWVGWLA